MRFGWREALGILLSAGLLWWVLDGKVAEVWAVLRTSSVPLFILSAAVGTATFPLRARRWRTILDPVEPNIPFGMLWRATAIGMMITNVIPARAGEIARAYALTRETPRVTFSASFASIAVDRVFDALVILLLMFLALLDPAFPAGASIGERSLANWAGGGTVLVLALFAVLYLIVFFPGRLIAIFELFARRVAPRIEARGRDALLAFAGGLSVLRSPRRFSAVLLWTIAHWLVNALAFWIAFRAVGIPAPFSAALFAQGLIAIGVAVPAAPGFWGLFEKTAVLALGLYGIDATRATSWAIGYHLVSFIPITVIGAVYFARLGLHLRELRTATERDG